MIAGFFIGLTLFFVGYPSFATTNFIRVPLANNTSIEIPKNWVVRSQSRRITIQAFVESLGSRISGSSLDFAANLYDDNNRLIALVQIWFYPNNLGTQSMARSLTPDDVGQVDASMRKSAEDSANKMGSRILKWHGSKVQVINNLYVFVSEYQMSRPGEDDRLAVRSLRVWNSPRSFSVTFNHLEREIMLGPIIDRMALSLRQD